MSHIKAIQNPHISHRLSHTILIFGPCMSHINSFGKGGHARESSLDDFDEITVSERRELSHIASGYVPVQSSSTSAISTTSASKSFPCL